IVAYRTIRGGVVFKSLPIVGLLVMAACVQPTLFDQPLGLENIPHMVAPPPWDQVAVGDIRLLVQSRLRMTEAPENSLRRVLEDRLGQGGPGKKVVLSVQNLWVASPEDYSLR